MTAPASHLPEHPINGAVSPLTVEVAGFIMEAKNTITYRDAVRVALKIIPAVREADRRAGAVAEPPAKAARRSA